VSQALCPECKQPSFIIETRAAHDSLRRRRKCVNNHRFSTLEVAADTPAKIIELVQWAVRNNVTENFEQYVNEILFNIPCQETELQKAA
jgi:transcriptional regulator NrdR family protein